jgi:hypothetical protein
MATSNPTPRDQQTPSRRYADPDNVDDPEVISAPTTTSDETHEPVWRRIVNGRSRYVLVVGAVLGVVLIGYGVLLGGGVVMSLLANQYVQAALGGTGVLGVGIVVGARRDRETIAHVDELELTFADGVQSWQGQYVELADGPAFKPFKGQPSLLRSQRPFTVKELAQEFPQLRAKRDLASEDDAIIELNQAYTEVQLTDRGTRVVSLCGGLRPVPYHGSAVFRADPPEMASKDRLQDANNLIKTLQAENHTLEERLSSQQNRLEELIHTTGQTRDEIVNDIVSMYQDLAEADSFRRSRSQSGSRSDNGDLPAPAQEALDRNSTGDDR